MPKTDTVLSVRLRSLRDRRGLTQQQVVDRSGKLISTTQVLSNYENGQREPSHETLCRLASIYGVTTDYLLGRTDEELPQAKSVEEMTGLSSHAISTFTNIPDASWCVNAIISSDELQDIFREMFLIRNMVERINNGKKFDSDPSDLYSHDDVNTVRIKSEEFFAYHSYRLGSAIAAALEKWAINEYGGDLTWEKPNPDIEFPF